MPKLCAVMGNPIAHSLSPVIHQHFAKQTGVSLLYEKILVPLDQFADMLQSFQRSGGIGLNITLPFKEQAFHLAQRHTPRAKQAKAVNTLYFENNTWLGDNTDGIGLVNDLQQNLNWPIHRKNILILGAGGAVRGILAPLLAAQPRSVTIANRTLSKAQLLMNDFPIKACTLNNIPSQNYDLIINGIGLHADNDSLALPKAILTKNTYCYDLSYAPKQATVFLAWAKQNGAQHISDGLGMLVEQAAESFSLWHGIKPNAKEVLNHFRIEYY